LFGKGTTADREGAGLRYACASSSESGHWA
jgi:hypothetical protein